MNIHLLKRLIYPALILAMLALVACTASSSSSAATTIGYGTVTEVTQTNTIEQSGSIEPRQVASVAWGTTGIIGEVLVSVGQQVSDGEVLMTLDPNSLPEATRLSQLKLAQMTSPSAIASATQAVLDAQSALNTATYARQWLDATDQATIDNAYYQYVLARQRYDQAKTDYDNWADEPQSSHYETDLAPYYTAMYNARVDMDSKLYTYNLYNSKSSAQTYAEYDNAVTLAQNKLTDAQNYLAAITGGEVPAGATGDQLLNFYQNQLSADSTNLRAPFAGIVAAIYDQPGILVSDKKVSLEVVDRSRLSITITVDESSVIELEVGMPANISVDVLPDLRLTGKVAMIEPVGQTSNGVVSYQVLVVLDQTDPAIPINASAQVSIQVGEPVTSLVVPASAVQSDSTGEFVQVFENGQTRRVDVKSGTILSDDTVIVTGELTPGEQVVLILQSSSSSSNGMGGAGGLLGGAGRGFNGGGQNPPATSSQQAPSTNPQP